MTTGQLYLDDSPPTGARHPATSFVAAERVKPKAATQRARVYEFIASQGNFGATDEEQQDGLGMPGNTQRPRRRELVQEGRVKCCELTCGLRWTRLTRCGNPATVWVVVRE